MTDALARAQAITPGVYEKRGKRWNTVRHVIAVNEQTVVYEEDHDPVYVTRWQDRRSFERWAKGAEKV